MGQVLTRLFTRLLIAALLSTAVACSDKKDSQEFTGTKLNGFRALTAEERAADFDQLLQLFKTNYGPYQYKEKRFGINIEQIALDLKAKALNAQTDEEFMGYVMQFGSALRDGHVQMRIESTASNIARYRIPIALTAIEGKAIIADIDAVLSTTFGLKTGDEILSVDGKTPMELVQMGLKYRHVATDLSDLAFTIPSVFSRSSFMTDLVPTKPLAEIQFQTAAGLVQTIPVPWTVDRYATGLTSVARPSVLDFSVPGIEDMNSIIDSHRGQMGQVNPIFLTPQSQATYNFVKVYPSDAARKKFGLEEKETPPIYAALYKHDGKTVLLVRNATYSPSDFKTTIYMKAYMALLSEYEGLADVLVLDQMHNPGGSYCAEFYNLFAKPGDVQGVEQARADRKWIHDLYVNWPNEVGPTGNPWEVKTVQAWGAIVEKAYDRGDFLSEPFPLFTDSNYATAKPFTWKKPMLVLIDELAGSCGDIFPMLVKANKRAPLMGQQTMGLGGNVEEVGVLNNSRIHVAMTRGLFFPYRPDGKIVEAEFVENNGVHPDIPYAHTVKDFRRGYVDYVKAFSDEAVKLVK